MMTSKDIIAATAAAASTALYETRPFYHHQSYLLLHHSFCNLHTQCSLQTALLPKMTLKEPKGKKGHVSLKVDERLKLSTDSGLATYGSTVIQRSLSEVKQSRHV